MTFPVLLGWFFPFGGFLFVLLACVLLAIACGGARRGACARAGPDARATLDHRLARGEITEAEHARLKDVISR